MLAKLARELPERDGLYYEPKWDGFRCIVFRDGDDVVLGSRNEKPLTRYFPELVESLRANLPDRCVIDGEIVIAGPDRPRLRCAVPTDPPGRLTGRAAGPHHAGLLRGLRPPGPGRRRSAGRALRRAPPDPRAGAGVVRTAGPPHPGHHQTGCGQGLVLPVRGGRAGRRGRQGRRAHLPAGQAGHDEGEARADGGLRRRGLPVAQVRRRRRLPPPRPVRRCRRAPPRGCRLRVQRRPTDRVRRHPGALPERRHHRPPVAGRRHPRRARPRWRRAVGARARTSAGSPSGPSWWWRSPTTTSRSTASATPRPSSAGVRTGSRDRAPMPSWTRRCPPSWKRSSAPSG